MIGIAKNQIQELIRNRFALVILFVAISLVLFVQVLGNLSVGERSRMLFDFGVLAIHLAVLTLSLILTLNFTKL